MVSMLPNTQRYDYTYKNTDLCDKPKYSQVNKNTIYDIIKSDKRFSKTLRLIEKAQLKEFFSGIYDGYTLFITEDSHIPDSFVNNADLFIAETFINSYTLMGNADIKYLLKNGSSVYTPKKYKYQNPILVIVDNDNIFVNKIGKITGQMFASNGIIQVMDNIAQVSYV